MAKTIQCPTCKGRKKVVEDKAGISPFDGKIEGTKRLKTCPQCKGKGSVKWSK